MTRERWAEIDRYLESLIVDPDPDLEAALEGDLPAIEVSPLQGKLLYLLGMLVSPRAVLELGTLGGYSTIWLARALAPGGRVTSLELDPHHAEVARANLGRAGLADRVDVIVGPALETLPGLSGPFDLVFLDADKSRNAEYFSWAVRLGRPGTLIVADNVIRGGAVLRDFFERLADEPRVEATAIQTVGVKGYDGFALARITS
jgi:predicted O-methyltransferase YrrM